MRHERVTPEQQMIFAAKAMDFWNSNSNHYAATELAFCRIL